MNPLHGHVSLHSEPVRNAHLEGSGDATQEVELMVISDFHLTTSVTDPQSPEQSEPNLSANPSPSSRPSPSPLPITEPSLSPPFSPSPSQVMVQTHHVWDRPPSPSLVCWPSPHAPLSLLLTWSEPGILGRVIIRLWSR